MARPPATGHPQRAMGLPSVTALVAFEAAARREGFKQAAADLNVTPAAVSQQIKALEQELGLALFHRNHRGVVLTDSGAHLFRAVRKGFDGILQTIEFLRQSAESGEVGIEVTTAVSAFWLTPHLTRFWREHPDVTVAQTVTDARQTNRACDLKIYYGGVADEPGDVRLLFRDRISVLASPSFLQDHGPVSLDLLARLPVIHMSAEDRRWLDWLQWAEMTGYRGGFGPGVRVNNYAIATQVAEDGLGLMLGWEQLLKRQIETGRLVRALPDQIEPPHAFYIAARSGASGRALLLRDWLLEAA
jgi:DNA-binding transcriptional LysR family regulator